MHYNNSSPATVNKPFNPPALFDFDHINMPQSCPDSGDDIVGGVSLSRSTTLVTSYSRSSSPSPNSDDDNLGGVPPSRSPTLVDTDSRSPSPFPDTSLRNPSSSQSSNDIFNSQRFRHLYEIRDELYIAFESYENGSPEETMLTYRSERFTHVISIHSTGDPTAPYADFVGGAGQDTLILNIPPPSREAQQAPIAQFLTAEKLQETHQFIAGAGSGISLDHLASILIPAERDTEKTLALTVDQLNIAIEFISEAGYELDTLAVEDHPTILITVPRGRKAEGMMVIACFIAQLAKFNLKEVVEYWDADTRLENTPWHRTISRRMRKTLERDIEAYRRGCYNH